MTLIDFHTHHPSRQGETVLQQGVHTWGVHPWEASTASATLPPDNWLAIGECGLDKLCNVPMDVQIDAFRKMVAISEERHLPLILHCVKAQAELLSTQKETQSTTPWIHHGFRGKPQQMQQLIRHGWFISFGNNFNEESVRQCPPERMLIETDESPLPVLDIYRRIAILKNISVERLASQMQENYFFLFGNRQNCSHSL